MRETGRKWAGDVRGPGDEEEMGSGIPSWREVGEIGKNAQHCATFGN